MTALAIPQSIDFGNDVVHILGNGQLEGHAKSISRLVHQLKLPEDHMFATLEDIAGEAYRLQESRIAYDPADVGF